MSITLMSLTITSTVAGQTTNLNYSKEKASSFILDTSSARAQHGHVTILKAKDDSTTNQ